ncbi:MAG: hypothetical protein ACOCQO_02135 [Halanaerobiaceae bacterium]
MINILKHISFARDWLDKAEEKIKYGSFLDGELYLSLAEAEVRKAWENTVSQRKKEEVVKPSKKRFSLIFASALSILLIFLAVNYFYTPARVSNNIELQLTDGFRERASLQEEDDFRLINVDLTLMDNNFDRRNAN